MSFNPVSKETKLDHRPISIAKFFSSFNTLCSRLQPEGQPFKYAMVAVFVLSWLLASSLVTQNHNGDYAQYILHAWNLASGNEWSYVLQNFPAVLPLYSIVLTPIVAIFGINFTVFSLASALMWAFSYLVISSIPFRSSMKRTRVALLGLFGLFSPLALAHTISATNHLMFAALCALLVGSIEHYSRRPSQLLALAIFLSAISLSLTRIEATWVILALVTLGSLRLSHRLLLFPLSLVPLSVSSLIEQFSEMRSYANESSSIRVFTQMGDLLSTYIQEFGNILSLISHVYLDLGNTNVSVAIGSVLFIGLVYSIKSSRNASLVALAIICTQPAILFVGGLNLTPPQYLLGAAMLIPLALGSSLSIDLKSGGKKLAITLLPVVLLFVQTHSTLEYNKSDFYTSGALNQAVQFAWALDKAGQIGFYKPRIMTLKYCTETPVCKQAKRVRSKEQALQVLDNHGIVVIRNIDGYGQEKVLEALTGLEDLKSNEFGGYVVFYRDDST